MKVLCMLVAMTLGLAIQQEVIVNKLVKRGKSRGKSNDYVGKSKGKQKYLQKDKEMYGKSKGKGPKSKGKGKYAKNVDDEPCTTKERERPESRTDIISTRTIVISSTISSSIKSSTTETTSLAAETPCETTTSSTTAESTSTAESTTTESTTTENTTTESTTTESTTTESTTTESTTTESTTSSETPCETTPAVKMNDVYMHKSPEQVTKDREMNEKEDSNDDDNNQESNDDDNNQESNDDENKDDSNDDEKEDSNNENKNVSKDDADGNDLVFNPPTGPKATIPTDQGLSQLDKTLFQILAPLGILLSLQLLHHGTKNPRTPKLFTAIINAEIALFSFGMVMFVILANQKVVEIGYGLIFLVSFLFGLVFAGFANYKNQELAKFSQGTMIGMVCSSVILALLNNTQAWVTLTVFLGLFFVAGLVVLKLVKQDAHLQAAVIGGAFVLVSSVDYYLQTTFLQILKFGVGDDLVSFSEFRPIIVVTVFSYFAIVAVGLVVRYRNAGKEMMRKKSLDDEEEKGVDLDSNKSFMDVDDVKKV